MSDVDTFCLSSKIFGFLQVPEHLSCRAIIIQPSEQKESRGMHQVCKVDNMALLQIKTTPMVPSLPSLATLLFNRFARDLLPKFSRPPMVSTIMKITILPLSEGSPV